MEAKGVETAAGIVDVDSRPAECRRIPNDAIAATKDVASGSYVYFLMDGEECVYVGQTMNLRQRVSGHPNKIFDRVFFIHVADDIRLSTEKEWISTLCPKYNGIAGRPIKPDEERRSKVLYIKLTPSEKREIVLAAKEDGQEPSVWLRELGLRAVRRKAAG